MSSNSIKSNSARRYLGVRIKDFNLELQCDYKLVSGLG